MARLVGSTHILAVVLAFGLVLMAFVSQVQTDENASRGCNDGTDCRRDECCLSKVLPIGKRSIVDTSLHRLRSRRTSSTKTFLGTCNKLGVAGSPCIIRDPPPDPTELIALSYCPCVSSLQCVNGTFFLVPQGQIGTCGWNREENMVDSDRRNSRHFQPLTGNRYYR
jgi:hypothetical protein